MTNLRIGLIGAGSMGSLHARVISGHEHCDLVWVADADFATAERVVARFGARAVTAPDLDAVDAVVVATPTQLHHEIATAVLEHDLPLLLEKPIADDLNETRDIIELSSARNLPLMCGLLERYNPAVRTAFDISRDPVHFSATRHSPYVDRIRTGVASDLLIHDVDLALRLFGSTPDSVKAVLSHAHPKSSEGSEDAVGLLLAMPGGRTVEISASRLAQRKIRVLTITEIDRSIEIDLIRQDITIHRHLGIDVGEVDGLGYRQQSIMEVPVIRYPGEPLALQLQRFIDLIEGRADVDAERASILPPHLVVEAARTPGAG